MSRVREILQRKALHTQACLQIVKVMMNYDYLWQNIRVLGGAYGCMSAFGRGGDTMFVSYRDPKLAKDE